LDTNLARLRIANRALARKTNKRSNRRKKCREHLAAVHRKIRNTRRNVHENVAKKLVDDFGMIGVENLNVAGMLKNKKLARSIADAGWSQFVTVLESTATRRGAEVVAVPPYNTSQNCSGCGVKVPKSLSMRTHECPECGLELDRDENAAKNILALALEIKKKGKNKKNKKVES
jgi:putative transposase